MAFKKAVKSQSKLRAAMFGPSGAGKTYSALAIASGMGTKIALIDSERSSASKYADRFDFDQVDLNSKSVDEYVTYINEAAEAGYEILIIDSLSHAWEVLNEEVQKIADAKYKGNFWAAWSEGTPQQRRLVNSIVGYPGHVIATMRSKTEWQTSGDGNKSRPVRVGLAPEQGKGIEYEFDILFEITPDHLANIIKDRTGKFQDKILQKPGKAFGKELIGWLNEGTPDLNLLCLNKITEIKNVMTNSDEPLFTAEEYAVIKSELAIIRKRNAAKEWEKPLTEQLPEIEKILGRQKEELQKRLSGEKPPVPPAPQSVSRPAPVSPAVPAPPAPPPPAQPQAAQVPSMYQEEEPPVDDGFVDDIPEPTPPKAQRRTAQKEMAAAPGDLDIF
jgi:hypothetical protein